MSKNINAAIGDEIRAARARIRWTQADLAHAIKMNPSTVATYESGNRRIKVDMLYRIAAVLDCEPTDFMPSVKAFEVTEE
jgi:transcriptional regulator with XRE-family HTH domain